MEQIKDVLPALFLSIVMYILLIPILKIGYSNVVTIGLQIILGVVIYVFGSIIFKISAFNYILKMIKWR